MVPETVPEQVNNTILRGVFPQGIEVFHWHGETFDIPVSGILLASSKACQKQAKPLVFHDVLVGEKKLLTILSKTLVTVQLPTNSGDTILISFEESGYVPRIC